MQYTVFADFLMSREPTGVKRNFLVEATDSVAAKAVFLVDWPQWEPSVLLPARCFVGGRHEGPLSVWEGMFGKTAILCERHGQNPPGQLPEKQPLF